jgi:hypothetical protein
MACDVLCSDGKISNVSEASPPYKGAEVFFPRDLDLQSYEDSKLVPAVLSYYYDIDESN